MCYFRDVPSLIISYIATILSKREASTNKAFGYKRAEIITAFVNAATLIVVAIILISLGLIPRGFFTDDIKLSEFDAILEEIEGELNHHHGINHVNIQPEFGKCDSKLTIVQD